MPLPLTTRVNGQVIDQTWFNDINTELVTLDGKHSALVDNGAISFCVDSDLEYLDAMTSFITVLLSQDITLNSALLKIFTNGTSGNLEIDIKFKRGAGAWTSVFQTKPKIPYTSGDDADSDTGNGATAAVIDSTYDELLAGDLLRLDIIDAPLGDGSTWPRGFILQLKRENTGS